MSINSIVLSADTHKFSIKLGKDQIEIITKPGLSDWNLISASTQLLAEYTVINPTDSILLYGCHQGALGVYLARNLPRGQLSITDINYTALDITQQTLTANNIPMESVKILTDVDLPLKLSQFFQVVILQIPKGRLLARRWLVQAYNALAIGGNLYIAGSNHAGIQSVIKDAQALFGKGNILAYKKGNRIARLIKKTGEGSLPDWAQTPGIAPNTWIEFSIQLFDHIYHISSLPGVFSYDHLDEGTRMLLNVTHVPPGAKVLDVGCGYGIIGLVAAVQGARLVHLIDNNLLAIKSCQNNITVNHITNAEVITGDLLYPIGSHTYDLILSNPPFHAGQAVDYRIGHAMIKQSFQALNPGGRVIIVANRFIRYDHMIKEIFGNISFLSESGKFHVLSGLKSS